MNRNFFCPLEILVLHPKTATLQHSIIEIPPSLHSNSSFMISSVSADLPAVRLWMTQPPFLQLAHALQRDF